MASGQGREQGQLARHDGATHHAGQGAGVGAGRLRRRPPHPQELQREGGRPHVSLPVVAR